RSAVRSHSTLGPSHTEPPAPREDRSAPRVTILTDSAACVPDELVRQYGLVVVPYQLIWDGQVYLDGLDMARDEFFRRFRTAETYPTTATPTVGQFMTAFTQAAGRADAIISILTSESLTSTVRLAQAAARESGLQDRVVVIDSHTAGPSQAFIVLAAARAAHRGASADEVIAIAEAYRERVGLLFSLEDLKHLHRGGRIGHAAALLGSRLHIHPVLALAEGVVRPVTITRTRQSALERIVTRAHSLIGDEPIRAAVLHADVPEEAERLARQVRREFDCLELYVSDFTPVMGAHTGPGLIGIAYCLEGRT
ncbi:MAG: DegV family protein, partial [Anaerolineae bacterium]|nr:DegV family protein [Anaerolineae bacterium]